MANAEKVQNQKHEKLILEMFQCFDKDGDGYLNYEESALFQWITDGNMLPPLIWDMVCEKVGVADKEKGISLDDFRRTYLDKALSKELDADLKQDYRQFIKWKYKDRKKVQSQPQVLEIGSGKRK
eukprot:g1693.t1